MANPVESENALPGTTSWMLDNPVPFTLRDPVTFRTAAIEGYASLTSVATGSALAFHVSTTAETFSIAIYRMGWYEGQGGRLVAQVGPVAGVQQAMPVPQDDGGLVACDWVPSYSLHVPPAWVSGVYLAKLTANAATPAGSYQSYVVFVVREDERRSSLLVQSSVLTWQAYNGWGGRSFYGRNCHPVSANGMVTKVSFNRPYFAAHLYGQAAGTTPYSTGSGHLLTHFPTDGPGDDETLPWPGWEYNMIRWLEKNGYDVKYCTNVDVHSDPSLLFSHRAFLSVGHDEYWTREMRFNVELARDQGVDIAFFGGNSVFDLSRLEPDAQGNPDRTVVCCKDHVHPDVVSQRISDGTATHDDLFPYPNVSGEFRDTSWPDTALTCSSFLDITFQEPKDLKIVAAEDWFFAGTGVAPGDTLEQMAGYETDGDRPTLDPEGNHAPSNRRTLASTDEELGKVQVYSVDGGATVFSAGTIQWSWGLDEFVIAGCPQRKPAGTNDVVARMTANFLARAQRTKGAEAFLYHTDGDGGIVQFAAAAGWRVKWSMIPGTFHLSNPHGLLLYDPTTGEGYFYAVAGDGGFVPIGKGVSGWRKTWRIIPGNFSGSGLTDLLFYDPARGEAEYYHPTPTGGVAKYGPSEQGWRRTWRIITGAFSNSGLTDLLFFDPAYGEAAFYRPVPSGGIQQIGAVFTGWPKTAQIVAGRFLTGSKGPSDLLVYDPVRGDAWFFSTDGVGGVEAIAAHQNWRRTWRIIPGRFSTSGFTDLLFYDSVAGEAFFYRPDGNGGMAPIGQQHQVGWRHSWQILPGAFSDDALTDLLLYDPFAISP